jgi:hypothetical protein
MKKTLSRLRVGPFLAVVLASALAMFGLWLLERPVREPAYLIELDPPPALLDQPFRHQFARTVTSAAAPAAH